jgi:sugar phosphate isomerase/epimerase
MKPTRRELLAVAAGAIPVLSGLAAQNPAPPPRVNLGLVIHSYPIRTRVSRQRGDKVPFGDPLNFLEHARARGLPGVQVALGRRERDYADRVRETLRKTGMYLEGIVALPRGKADVERFTAEVRSARECGASILRTVCLSGRRYETFKSADAFREFTRQSQQSLVLAEPVVARHDMRLAVENHKDWRVEELLALLKRLDSRHVGVCLDTGNSIALLEEPHVVVEAYAPWAFTTHVKDMGVAEYDEGFLLSEVPLGAGFLDLPRVVATLRKARPEIHFNLEMITRDPLRVPCLTRGYWVTFESLPGRHLADTLAMVRRHAAKQPLPRVSNLKTERQLEVEEANVRQSVEFARAKLGLQR